MRQAVGSVFGQCWKELGKTSDFQAVKIHTSASSETVDL